MGSVFCEPIWVARLVRFLGLRQRSDGSWYGCWGNCFTYGCWFGVEGLEFSGGCDKTFVQSGLLCAGRPRSCAAIQKCVKFLLGSFTAWCKKKLAWKIPLFFCSFQEKPLFPHVSTQQSLQESKTPMVVGVKISPAALTGSMRPGTSSTDAILAAPLCKRLGLCSRLWQPIVKTLVSAWSTEIQSIEDDYVSVDLDGFGFIFLCSKDSDAIQRGIALLWRRQLPTGDWPQENIAGVFNRSVGITLLGLAAFAFCFAFRVRHLRFFCLGVPTVLRYTAFRNVFPLWALGHFAKAYGPRHGCKLAF